MFYLHDTPHINTSCGVADLILSWYQSRLNNLSLYVVANSNKLSILKITSGGPQGSHLGSIFFIISIRQRPSDSQTNKK